MNLRTTKPRTKKTKATRIKGIAFRTLFARTNFFRKEPTFEKNEIKIFVNLLSVFLNGSLSLRIFPLNGRLKENLFLSRRNLFIGPYYITIAYQNKVYVSPIVVQYADMAEKESNTSKLKEIALKTVGWAVVIGVAFLGLNYAAAKLA